MYRLQALLIAGALATLSCGRATVGTTLRTEHIGTKYARLTGYFATRGAAPGGTHTEETPGDIRHEVIRDEATLARFSRSESCFDVTIRTHSTHDEPLDQLEPKCELDGADGVRAVAESEKVSIYDYSYTGTLEVAHVEGIAVDKYVGMSISRPAEKVFRVVERKASVCCPVGGGKKLALDLTNPHWDVAEYNYHVVFEWTIQ